MSLSSKMLRSSVWVYFAQWFSKLAGFISTIVLARILTPDDFGIVASAAIVTSIFFTLTSVGPETYLLRKEHISEDDLNTAWSVGIILKFLVFLGVFFTAPLVGDFFNEVRLIEVLQIVSIFPFVLSFNNIGMLLFKKEMDYKPAFKLGVFAQLLSLATKIGLALYWGNYWAFIVAELVAKISFVVGSYYLHSFRPIFSLVNIRDQWAFSQWVLAKGIFSNIRYKIDNILIAKVFSAQALGLYSTAKDIATMPAGQIVEPLTQPLYVGLASYKNSPKIFADKVHKSMLSAAMIAFPIAFGISAVASPLVIVLLGEKWHAAISIVEILSFLLLSGVFNSLTGQILNVLGRVKASFFLDVILGVFTIVIFVTLATKLNISEFALLRVAIGIVSAAVMFLYLERVSKISLGKVLILILPVFIMALGMYFFVNFIAGFYLIKILAGQLIFSILLGVLFYSLLSLLVVFILKKYLDEYEFLWKTFYLPLFSKLKFIKE